MISLIISFAVLIAGFLTYGRVAEKAFAPDDRETQAYRLSDGVDYVPMKTWKAFLVQLLNIAGTGIPRLPLLRLRFRMFRIISLYGMLIMTVFSSALIKEHMINSLMSRRL